MDNNSLLPEIVKKARNTFSIFIFFCIIVLLTLLILLSLPESLLHTSPIGALILISSSTFFAFAGLCLLTMRLLNRADNMANMMQVLLDSPGQGFFVFDSGTRCGTVCSVACKDLLGIWPSNQLLADVLKIPEHQRNDFYEWIAVIFQPDHAMAFEDIVRFLPTNVPNDKDRVITIAWNPIKERDGTINRVAVILTDQTDEQAALNEAKKQQDFVEMMSRVFRERNQFYSTLMRLSEFVDASSIVGGTTSFDPALRQIHNLKAAARHFHLVEVANAFHDIETDMRASSEAENSERERIFQAGINNLSKSIMNLNTEVRNLLGEGNEWGGHSREVGETELYEFAEQMRTANVSKEIIKEYLTKIVAVPIRDCLHTFEREMKDLARILGKYMKPVIFTGQNPRVLSLQLQPLFFSLTHIGRNIIDHGIEAPATRLSRGKDEAGQVTIKTEIIKDKSVGIMWLKLEIQDDGNGIDPDRIRTRLETIDPNGNWKHETDNEVIQHIFMWGLTTAKHITELSGRGVGLESVKHEVEKLGGKIKVSSILHKETCFEILIPWTMEIELGNRRIGLSAA